MFYLLVKENKYIIEDSIFFMKILKLLMKISFIGLLLLFSGCFFNGDSVKNNNNDSNYSNVSLNISNPSNVLSLDDKIIIALKKNKDGKEYLKINSDYTIINKTKITPQMFNDLVNNSEFGSFF